MPRDRIDLWALAGISRPTAFAGNDLLLLQLENLINELFGLV